MGRYLVVVNQTLGGDSLLSVVRQRTAKGSASLFVLVPATPRSSGFTWTDSEVGLLARDRLERALAEFREVGADADGRIGDSNAFDAIQDIVREERFDEIIVSSPPRTNLARRVRETFKIPVTLVTAPAEQETKSRALLGVPLLADVSKRRLRSLAKAAVTRDYRKGDVVVAAGSTQADLFVILDGRVSVHRDGRTVATMRAGDVFGEIALLDGGVRTADVVAEAPTSCVRLAATDFRAALEADPRLARAVLRHVGGLLRELVRPPAD